ncbi:MAG: hypothetical protein IPI97_14100 [Nitrosomonas sp.]|nr:hypothetical protein [Nitrosomonas sp.]
MKTQKVEIELPEFEDWEFVRLGKLTESELLTDYFGMLSFGTEINPPHIAPAVAYANFSHCFIYRRKNDAEWYSRSIK